MQSFMASYKRRLKEILVGILILIGVGIFLMNKEKVILFVNEKTVGAGDSSQIYTYVEEYDVATEYVYSEVLYEDESYVFQQGESGSKSVTVMAVYEDGKETEEKILDREVIEEAVPEIIYVGTKERPEYIVPLEEYVVTSNFGQRWGTIHHGIDFGVPQGTDVMAARDGVIIQTGWNGDLGISIYVEHSDGVITRYAHLSESLVELGQSVSQGEVIGHSGNTGYSTGPHLHFEVRINGEAVEPRDYIQVE